MVKETKISMEVCFLNWAFLIPSSSSSTGIEVGNPLNMAMLLFGFIGRRAVLPPNDSSSLSFQGSCKNHHHFSVMGQTYFRLFRRLSWWVLIWNLYLAVCKHLTYLEFLTLWSCDGSGGCVVVFIGNSINWIFSSWNLTLIKYSLSFAAQGNT